MSTLEHLIKTHREHGVSAGFRYIRAGNKCVREAVLYGSDVETAVKTKVEVRLQELDREKAVRNLYGEKRSDTT